MPKLTVKYIGAVIAAETFLEGELINRLSYAELYSALQARGWHWDGKAWKRQETAETGPDTLIRVMGEMSAVEETTLNIAAALVARGYRIVKKSELHKNYQGSEVRQYMTVAKGDNDNGN